MSDIDEVKQRTDIVEVVGQYVQLSKAGRLFKGLCPFHSEKTPSFFVYPEQQTWHCFGACSTGGDVFSFIMKKEGVGFGDALRLLADRTGVTLRTRSEAEGEGKERLYQASQAAALFFHNSLLNSSAGERARKYVASRGLLPKTVADFQLGFSLGSWGALKQYLEERGYTEDEMLKAGLIVPTEKGKSHDRFRNHLMFPILDGRGRTTGFGARVLDDSLPKYVNSPETPIFDKSSSLYGINLARSAIREQGVAVVVEGYMDVIIAHQHGFSNVVAAMGTSITEKQVSQVKRLTRNMALALDADAAGEGAMLRGVSYENSLDAEVKVIILPQGKDPDEVIREDAGLWQRLVAGASPVIDYYFGRVTAGLDLGSAGDKSRAVNELLKIVAEIKDDIRRDHYLNKLARLTETSYNRIEAALSRIKPDRRAREAKSEALGRATRPAVSHPVEEYCLALLLKHPELKAHGEGLSPEYFEDMRNREILVIYQESGDPSEVREKLDSTIREHLDSLLARDLPATRIEPKFDHCVLRLREGYLRTLEARRAEVLALASESGGTAAELAELEGQGIETSIELGKIFVQKSKRWSEPRR